MVVATDLHETDKRDEFIDGGPVGILDTVDRDRIWQRSSDLMALLDAGELAGTPFTALVHPLEREFVAGRLAAIRTGRGAPRLEVRMRHKNGEYVHID